MTANQRYGERAAFAERLVADRRAAGLTQEEVAAAAGIKRGTYAQWEAARVKEPRPAEGVVAVARLFRVDAEEYLRLAGYGMREIAMVRRGQDPAAAQRYAQRLARASELQRRASELAAEAVPLFQQASEAEAQANAKIAEAEELMAQAARLTAGDDEPAVPEPVAG